MEVSCRKGQIGSSGFNLTCCQGVVIALSKSGHNKPRPFSLKMRSTESLLQSFANSENQARAMQSMLSKNDESTQSLQQSFANLEWCSFDSAVPTKSNDKAFLESPTCSYTFPTKLLSRRDQLIFAKRILHFPISYPCELLPSCSYKLPKNKREGNKQVMNC